MQISTFKLNECIIKCISRSWHYYLYVNIALRIYFQRTFGLAKKEIFNGISKIESPAILDS